MIILLTNIAYNQIILEITDVTYLKSSLLPIETFEKLVYRLAII